MRIAVVGGGLSGLVTAFSATQAGASVTLYEASDTLGGPLRTIRRDGFLAEEGPHTILATPELLSTMERLGLSDQLLEANSAAHRRFVVKDGEVRALPGSQKELLTSDLYSAAAKLSLLKEPFVSPREDDVDESVTNFIERRLHPDLLTYGLELMVNGIWAGDPNKLSARYAFKKMYGLEQKYGSLLRGAVAMKGTPRSKIVALKNGNADFVTQISKHFETRLSTPVRKVKLNKKSVQVDGEKFEHVVVTSQRTVLTSIDFRGGTPLDLPTVEGVNYPPVSIVSLGFHRDDVEHALDGFGMIVPEIEKRPVLGALFPSTMFPDRAPNDHVLIAVFVGGARHPDLGVSPNLATIAFDGIKPLLGISAPPVFEHVATWPNAIPQYNVGHGLVMQALETFERSNPRLSLVGGLKDGISVPDLVKAANELGKRLGSQ